MKEIAVPITVTFRHIAPTDALRSHAEKKLNGIAGMVPGATDVHVVLSASPHRHRQSAEITIHGAHHVLSAHEETADLYAAIDLAVAKIDSQVRKAKGRVIEAPRRGSTTARRSTPPTASA